MENRESGFIENYNKKITKTAFVKSYSTLNRLNISPMKKMIIELVLSFQANGNDFYMNYRDIADYCGIKYQSVKDNIFALKKLGYLSTINTSNYNGKNGGSSTSIKVNEEFIVEELNRIEEEASALKKVKVKEELDNKIIKLKPNPIKDGKSVKGVLKELPEVFYVTNDKRINFEDTLSYFLLPNEIELKKKEYFIDESNTCCLFLFVKEVLALYDKKENTKFLDIFNSIPMAERPRQEIS